LNKRLISSQGEQQPSTFCFFSPTTTTTTFFFFFTRIVCNVFFLICMMTTIPAPNITDSVQTNINGQETSYDPLSLLDKRRVRWKATVIPKERNPLYSNLSKIDINVRLMCPDCREPNPNLIEDFCSRRFNMWQLWSCFG